MPMLTLGDEAFSVGRARFQDALPTQSGRSNRVYVKVSVNGMDEPFLALLDTGAEYTWLSREIAEEVGLLGADGESIVMENRAGKTPGTLVRATLTMLADQGDALDVHATVFVPDRDGPSIGNFLGYSGLLERVRFGLDPLHNQIYFGGY
jgi:Aspartyl protease